MKVVVINGSPERKNDSTSLVLTPFLDGLLEAGTELALFRTNELEIKPCRNCKKCLYKTPGECYQRDDMAVVLSELSRAEVWVYATPATHDGLSAPMKRLVDRMLPLTWQTIGSQRYPTWSVKRLVARFLPSTEPMTETQDNGPFDDSQPGIKAGKLVFVSGCESRELGYFEPLVQQMRSVAQTHGKEFAGALLRPHGDVVGLTLKAGGSLDDIVAGAYEAGRQLVQEGKMRPETLAVVSREILLQETSVITSNQRLQQASAVA